MPRAGGPEALAVELHARHMYDAACVLELFEMLPRAEVTRLSQSKGSVFAGGSYSHGPIKGLRHFTKEFPNVFRYLCACILHVLPTHKFSSLLISDSVESEPHSDPNNGPTLNLLVPLTNFTGGSLLLGETCELDFKLGAWAFNARDCPHSVLPFEGRRLMLIAYSSKDVWNFECGRSISSPKIVALFYPTPAPSCLPRRKDLCPIFGLLSSLLM